jgi:ABC-type multidrug transport system ATPase subunit
METVVRAARGAIRSSTRTLNVVFVLAVGTPPILLADEPTGNLDEATSDQLIRVIAVDDGYIGSVVVLVTHNSRIASKADHVVTLIPAGRVRQARRVRNDGSGRHPEVDGTSPWCDGRRRILVS